MTTKIHNISIRNFRRLENVSIDIEEMETVFVGPNNSGKTSATAIFRCFLDGRDFRIYDFSVGKIAQIDQFGETGDPEILPAIELDIWLSIDPDSIDFGRAFMLLPELSDEFTSLGVRLKFSVSEPTKMRAAYVDAYPQDEAGNRKRSLTQFLALDGNLKRYFETSFFALERIEENVADKKLDPKDGKNLLKALIQVDFVDAQRNINDEEMGRSNRLSAAFAAFYKNNLDQAEAAATAHAVIDENNRQLTDHYAEQFSGIMTVIKGLGVPSINDRDLKIVSSLSPENALKGNTELLYVDTARNHELPELYNGLGFKNLIYMAIQVRHYHLKWMRTPSNRPLCQIIFIEEPEVHLHAQVQQTFIANIWKVIADSAQAESDAPIPQLIVTTHSSHILDAVDFAKVRYFRRCHLDDDDQATTTTLNASQVHSLSHFQPKPIQLDDELISETDALEFLKRYLKLTHCDMFFADAVILVEGTVEKLLLPIMIEKAAAGLRSTYLTVLEVGGAYAHRFEGLLQFLHIPYLVITDLDSVSAEGHHATCRADTAEAQTSNATLKQFFKVKTVAELMTLTSAQKEYVQKVCYVTFQDDVSVSENNVQCVMRPRTLEESIAYHNFAMLRDGQLRLGVVIPTTLDDAYEAIYQQVRSTAFKKTEFALGILAGPNTWEVPTYIASGLQWLEGRLVGDAKATPEPPVTL